MSFPTRLTIVAVYFLLKYGVFVEGDLQDILSICDDGSCVTRSDPNMFDYRKSLYDFLTGGFGKIIWDGLSDDKRFLLTHVSTSCRTSLQNTIDGIRNGHRSSLELVSATGSRPEKFFQATLATLGDFDSCLDLQGRYCLVDVFPTRWSKDFRSRYPGHLFLDEITKYQNFSLMTGVCLPSECSTADIRLVLEEILPNHHLLVKGHFDCVTKEDNSFPNRLLKMTKGQVVAAAFVGLIVGLVTLSSLVHLYYISANHSSISRLEDLEQIIDFRPMTRIDQIVDIFSPLKNMFRLLSTRSYGHYFLVDLYKLSLVIFGCLGHAFVCVEIPNSYFMLESQKYLHDTFSSATRQVVLNDNGLVIFAHLGGFATFTAIYPTMIKIGASRFPYILAIFDRYARFIPSIMSVVALEFLWPLAFDGPFFKRVGDFVLSKCSKSWWWNLTFLQNWWPVLDICGGHTFFSAVDMQLFILGLVIVSLLAANRKNGLMFGLLVSVVAIIRVLYNGYVHESTMTMFTPFPKPHKILEYLDYIHMSTPIYVAPYMIGIVNGLLVHSGFRFQVRNIFDHLKYNLVTVGLPIITITINGLYNEFQLIPQSLVPPLIVVNRLLHSGACFIFLTYFMSIESSWSLKLFDGSKYSVLQAITRLSYSIYLSNYLVVKTDFFTSRSLFATTTYAVTTRLLSSLTIMTVVAVVFHLVFVAPFDGLRRMAFKAIRTSSEKSD